MTEKDIKLETIKDIFIDIHIEVDKKFSDVEKMVKLLKTKNENSTEYQILLKMINDKQNNIEGMLGAGDVVKKKLKTIEPMIDLLSNISLN